MRLARYLETTMDGKRPRIAVQESAGTEYWYDLRTALTVLGLEAGATLSSAQSYARTLAPRSMSAALAGGGLFDAAVRQVLDRKIESARVLDPIFTNAVDPIRYRDFMTFEEHFTFGFAWRGEAVPDVMYELPVSYAGDPRSFLGPDDIIPWPNYSERLDYELELGIVIGRTTRNVTPDTALDHVAGLTILNDVSARDMQAREMGAGLGPSKGKHFACVTGPVLTSLDELGSSPLTMRATVNGELLCETTSDQMVWSVAEIVAWASREETLEPGTLLGTGTCNGGSTVEIGVTLSPGDRIELDVTGLGTLGNTFALPGSGGWDPTPRRRHADGRAEELRFLR